MNLYLKRLLCCGYAREGGAYALCFPPGLPAYSSKLQAFSLQRLDPSLFDCVDLFAGKI